jgi:hypothetical protein
MILTKHINFEGQMIIAVIDDELLGQNYETDELQLDFSSKFYAGEIADEETIISEMLKSYMAICAGEETIRMLIDREIITRDDVNIIAGIPYVYVSLTE